MMLMEHIVIGIKACSKACSLATGATYVFCGIINLVSSSIYNAIGFTNYFFILGGLLLPTGLFGMFGEEKILKTPLSLGLGLTVLKVGCEIAGMILLAQCKEMHIYLEFGSYISVLSSGIVLIGQIILLGLSKSKRKD